jgi:hypothetical protein
MENTAGKIEAIYIFQPSLSNPFMQTAAYDFGTEVGDWDAILAKQGWERMGTLPPEEPGDYPISMYLHRYREGDKAPEVGKFLVEVQLFEKSLMTVFCNTEPDLLTLLRDWACPLIGNVR